MNRFTTVWGALLVHLATTWGGSGANWIDGYLERDDEIDTFQCEIQINGGKGGTARVYARKREDRIDFRKEIEKTLKSGRKLEYVLLNTKEGFYRLEEGVAIKLEFGDRNGLSDRHLEVDDTYNLGWGTTEETEEHREEFIRGVLCNVINGEFSVQARNRMQRRMREIPKKYELAVGKDDKIVRRLKLFDEPASLLIRLDYLKPQVNEPLPEGVFEIGEEMEVVMVKNPAELAGVMGQIRKQQAMRGEIGPSTDRGDGTLLGIFLVILLGFLPFVLVKGGLERGSNHKKESRA